MDEPSTLFALWPEADLPLEEEVRLALRQAYPGVEQVDQLEAGNGLQWGTVYRLPDLGPDFLVWAERRGDLPSDFLDEGLEPGPELEAARGAVWMLGVETILDPGQPLASFQRQLRFLVEVTVPGLPAVYDDNALIVRSGRKVRELARCSVPPRANNLYAVHCSAGQGGTWVHTHGLARAALPDLDLLGIPGDALPEACDLLEAVAEALLAGNRPDGEGRLLLGEGLELRALGLEAAMPLFPANQAGGSEDRRDDGSDHGGNHLVLLDPWQDQPPRRLLSQVAQRGIVFKSRGETERQRVLSRSRWGTFGQLFAMHRGDAWRFHVKLAYERDSRPETREHLWFEVLDLKPNLVRGRLLTAPADVSGLQSGRPVWEPLSRLTDWLIVTPEGTFDPEGAPVLLEE